MKKIILLVLISATSIAENAALRCAQDTLDVTGAKGRNAWAAKYGYISQENAKALDDMSFYVSFTEGSAPSNPSDGDKAPRWSLATPCAAGCYTPSQKLLFTTGYKEIERAYYENESSYMALSKGSNETLMRYTPMPLHSQFGYLKSKSVNDEDILVIQMENGLAIEVTPNHPLVDGEGNVLMASQVSVGAFLLDATGQARKILSIDPVKFTGIVWNIIPKSENRRDNIVVAEGFLTGSARFQNQWSDEAYRLLLRETIDVEKT